MKKWKLKKSELVFEEKFFKVRKDLVELPSGETIDWTYWDSPDSVMVLGATKDRKLIMIRQFRYLVGKEVLEFPAGAVKEGENLKAAAKREFKEEAGYECKNLKKLCSVYETYGQLNRKIHIFFANVSQKSFQNWDRGRRGFEDIRGVKLVPFGKIVESVLNNKMPAMGCGLAILLLKEKIRKGEIKL